MHANSSLNDPVLAYAAKALKELHEAQMIAGKAAGTTTPRPFSHGILLGIQPLT